MAKKKFIDLKSSYRVDSYGDIFSNTQIMSCDWHHTTTTASFTTHHLCSLIEQNDKTNKLIVSAHLTERIQNINHIITCNCTVSWWERDWYFLQKHTLSDWYSLKSMHITFYCFPWHKNLLGMSVSNNTQKDCNLPTAYILQTFFQFSNITHGLCCW